MQLQTVKNSAFIITLSSTFYQQDSNLDGPPITKRTVVLPWDLSKSRSPEIRVLTFPIALKFDRHLRSRFYRYDCHISERWYYYNIQSRGLETSRDLHGKTSVRLVNRGPDLTRYNIHFGSIITRSISLIARFMWPTWGPSGANRTQVGPMLAPWTLLSGYCPNSHSKLPITGLIWGYWLWVQNLGPILLPRINFIPSMDK